MRQARSLHLPERARITQTAACTRQGGAEAVTPDEIDLLYESVMLAAPMAAVGVALFLMVWLWPVRRKP